MTLQGLKRKPPKEDQKCSRLAPQLFWTLQRISTQFFLIQTFTLPTKYYLFISGKPLENRALDFTRDAKWLADRRLLRLNPDTGSRETIASNS